MGLRDIFVITVILLSAPIALMSAYYGILVWTWIAYFNPHRYAWGLIRSGGIFQPAMIIAIPTLIGTLFAEKNTRFLIRESVLLAALWAWMAFNTLYISFVPEFAGHVQDANTHLAEVSKILLMTFLTILLVCSKTKLRVLVLVILASFGIKALVAAVFYLQTGGEFQIWGPEGSFLYDNNDFGLAMNMTIPMFFYMAQAEEKWWIRAALRGLMVCVAICVIGTYSRGGLLGLSAVTLMIVAKSRQKVIGLFLVCVAMVGMLTLTTTAWKDRMSAFLQGNLDTSAYSRLVAWSGGWNLVMTHPLTGGGFDIYTDEAIFPNYVPSSVRGFLYGKNIHLHSSHSIYFQILGEQGFVGLGLFLWLLGSCFINMGRLRKQAGVHSELGWVVPYTNMFQVTLLAYMISGATLGRAYFDFFYQIVALVVVLRILAARDLREASPEEEPVEALEPVAA
jgi:probable O-glycosylation ligase (exosortase A-associated)